MSLKKRLIPVLLLRNGMLVRSETFTSHQVIGAPLHEVQRFNEWNVDELIYLDITRDDNYDTGRDDHSVQQSAAHDLSGRWGILDAVSERCFMPLTFGGRLRTLSDIHTAIARGADKVALNTQAVKTPGLIEAAAKRFGSQAVVVSIDVDQQHQVLIDGGRVATGMDVVGWAKQCQRLGAGELLLQVKERDGAGTGYDIELISKVAAAVTVPIIACSGVGKFEHYADGIRAGASAVAAANIWHFKELADRAGRRALKKAGIDVR